MNTIISIWFDGWHSIDPKLVHPLPKSEWRIRWVSEIIPNHEIAVLETDGEILGFITVNFKPAEGIPGVKDFGSQIPAGGVPGGMKSKASASSWQAS